MKDFLDALFKADLKVIATIAVSIAAGAWALLHFIYKNKMKELETSLTLCRKDRNAQIRDALSASDGKHAKVVGSLNEIIEELNKKQAELESRLKESHALKEEIWWDLKELRSLAGDPVQKREALIEKWRELKTKYPDIQKPPDPQLRITRGPRAPSGPERL